MEYRLLFVAALWGGFTFNTSAASTNGLSGVAASGPAERASALVVDETASPLAAEFPVLAADGSVSNLTTVAKLPPPKPPIHLVKGGAESSLGLLDVHFAANVNAAAGAVRITLPGGGEWRAQPRFLAFTDATGRSQLLAELKDSVGGIRGNTVVYRDCFTGVKATVRFTLEQGRRFHSDVILHQDPVSVATARGLTLNDTTRLELWTELLAAPSSRKERQLVNLHAEGDGPVAGDVEDDTLDFGAARVVAGRAFMLDDEGESARRLPVAKSVVTVRGRTFLIETLDLRTLRPMLNRLGPARQASLRPTTEMETGMDLRRELPAATPASVKADMLLASVEPPAQGFVLDYVLMAGIPAPAGIISWWPAAANAQDARGLNHGTASAGVTYEPGKVGQSFHFNGNNNVVVPSSTTLNPASGLTVEFWVNAEDQSYWDYDDDGNPVQYFDHRDLVSKDGETANRQYFVTLNDQNQFRAHINAGGILKYIDSTTTVQFGQWYHVAMTWDQAVLRLYVNGTLEKSGSAGGAALVTGEPVRIGGGAPAGPGYYFMGRIDDPAIYSRALGETEIDQIFDANAAGKYNPICTPSPLGLVSWWPGDDNTHDLARVNHATWQGTPVYGAGRAAAGFVSEYFLAKGFQTSQGSTLYVAGRNLEIPNRPELNPTEGITLEAWVYPTNTAYGHRDILSKDGETTERQWLLTLSSANRFHPHVWSQGGTIAHFDGTTPVTLNAWYHVVMTYDRTSLKLYVNGVLNGSLAATFPMGVTTQPVRIGGGAPAGRPQYCFAGIIDETSVYSRALSANEVTALFAAGGAGKCRQDSDGDGLTDQQELVLGTNRLLADTDNDGLSDGTEHYDTGTNPLNGDEDSDGMPDAWEWKHFGSLSETGDGDFDHDGLSNVTEWELGTNPVKGPVSPQLKVVHGEYAYRMGYHSDFDEYSAYTDVIWNFDEKTGGYGEFTVTEDYLGEAEEWYAGVRVWLQPDENGGYDPTSGLCLFELWEESPDNVVDTGYATFQFFLQNFDFQWNPKVTGHLGYVDERTRPTTGEWTTFSATASNVKLVFRTGGHEGSITKKLYELSATVTPIQPPWETPRTVPEEIPYSQIMIRHLGYPLDANGNAYAALTDNQEYDVTVDCPEDYYGFDVGDLYADVDLDIDSDNDNKMDAPDRLVFEDSVEEITGSKKYAKHVARNTDDNDGDGIPDFADGFNLDGTEGNSDDVNGSEKFVPLVLKIGQPIDPSVALVRLMYSAAPPSSATPGAPGSAGLIRIWMKDGNASRNKNLANGVLAGDYVAAGAVHTCAQLGIGAASRTVTLYVEGVNYSAGWGDGEIKVEVDPDGNGSGGFVQADLVKLTVIESRFTLWLVRPYVYRSGTGTREAFSVSYATPRDALSATLEGFSQPDPLGAESGWHGSDAFLGHVFVHLLYRGPGTQIDEYFGQTGSLDGTKAYQSFKGGTYPWTTGTGSMNTRGELDPVWVSNAHQIQLPGGGSVSLVVKHRWTIPVSRFNLLKQFVSAHNYSRFGLDIDATGGGCSALAGGAMKAAAFTEQNPWEFNQLCPTLSVDPTSQASIDAYMADPRSASWPTAAAGWNRRLRFYDTARIASWMDSNAGDTLDW